MQRKFMWIGLGTAAISAAIWSGNAAYATPAVGYVSNTLAMSTFPAFEVFNESIPPAGSGSQIWLSWQKTIGNSDVYVQNNSWDPGGDTGWHSHPGHSLIIVTSGTVTDYEADDTNCTPHTYTAGQAFVDQGGDHAHIIRNEGSVQATTIAIQVIPSGAARRIDVNNPGTSPF
jgi:hypothetical protein